MTARSLQDLLTTNFGLAPSGYTGSQGASGINGYTGSQGETGLGFAIAKSYNSVAALTADTSPTGITAGQFAIIETGDVENPENSRLYLWNGTVYSYVSDLSGNIGLTGPQGVIGYTGSRGQDGTIGVDGYTGSQGLLGYTGSQGVGYTGSQGNNGYTGSQGIQGDAGVIGYTGSAGTGGSSSSSGTSIKTLDYAGQLVVNNGTKKWWINNSYTINRLVGFVDVPPTGSNLSLRVNKNGLSSANLIITNGSSQSNANVSISTVEGDYITVDITQVGSTTPGNDLTLIFEYSTTQ